MPRTSVCSTIPAGSGSNRSADKEERAHDEHTDPHRENEAACMRTTATHGTRFNNRKY